MKLSEIKRLHDLGFAIILLHQKSKRPKESGWTSGDRHLWSYIKENFKEGDNIGVRLGEPSHIGGKYLACIDVDVKNPEYKTEALALLKNLVGNKVLPEVRSGSGNGSRHLYCVTDEPFKMITVAKVKDCFEICVYSSGRQMVLPPSIHPNGKAYAWFKDVVNVNDLPLMEFDRPDEQTTKADTKEKQQTVALNDFKVEVVDLDWLPISDKIREGIKNGKDVRDRSGYLLQAASALLSAGLNQNEILSVLTDPDTYLGACAYDHVQSRNRGKAAEWVYKYTLSGILAERIPANVFSKASDMEKPRVLSKEEIEEQSLELLEERPWQQSIYRSGQNGMGPPKSTIENVVLILTHDISPMLVVRDEFAIRDSYGIDTPWGGVKGDALSDDDITKIKYWLGVNWGFEPNGQVVNEAVIIMACANTFDPVKKQLMELPAWDGVARLDTWLVDNFEAKANSDEAREYYGQVFRKWMVALVLRAFKPGAKFDWMPIFEGAQGIGKSSFGRLLVGGKYFLDWLPNLADKDSALALQGMWCVEMGELSQFRKNEIEVIKGFVTRTVDKIRPPYGTRWIESARRCVFFGTTNKETYLRDDSGNRRFKPVKVGALDFEALERDRTQLFAEAKYLFDEKIETERTLDLTEKAAIFQTKIQQEKLVEDDSNLMYEVLREFMEKDEKDQNFNFKKFALHDMFSGTAPLNRWRLDQRNMQFAGKALKMLGAKNWKSHGRKMWKVEKEAFGDPHQKSSPPEDFY